MGYYEGKYAVVTGGSKGIGAAIVKRFLDDGMEGVALLGRGVSALEETAKRLDPTGKRAVAVQCDVSDLENVEEAFSSIFKRFESVEVLVNNAGFTRDAVFHRMSAEQFTDVIDVHLKGAFYCTKQVAEHMRKRKSGRIISISSNAAYGNVGQANYSAAKAALIGLTNTLAMELGSKNVTVNCVAPGLINTDIIKSIPDNIMTELLKSIPLGRIGEPEEVAGVVSFLAGPDGSYITGQCINCAGGRK
jgi:3-oxoacyl-[acyl-carrier protein] reductase